ncbi:MAG: ATP-binding protein [Bacteroidia bacterium]|nr:ATP-binding protein [Bacteroidia bacterium]
MLIQFSVRNFRTFKEKATLSLIASNYDKDTRETDNIFDDSKFNLRILKSAVIYGANASGKSKFIEALMFMKSFVTSSNTLLLGNKIPVEPFKLNKETENEPSEFEVVFSIQKVIYRYGFEVDKEQVVSEWLFNKPKSKEVKLFYREYQKFETHPKNFSIGTTLAKGKLIKDNTLMLSAAAAFNDDTSVNIIDWFYILEVISGSKEHKFQENSLDKIKNNKNNAISKEKIAFLEYLNKADLGIVDLEILDSDSDELRDGPNYIVKTLRNKFANGTKIGTSSLFLNEDESEGTKKYFYLLGPIIDAIETGSVLVVDELDSKIHPNLVEKIVSLFNSRELNLQNAQLIFNTHDTNLLSSGLFRRDQIWFTEKDKYGEAKLYSLADFKSDEVRKSEPFEENYVRGKYGAVPYLGFFDNISHDKFVAER